MYSTNLRRKAPRRLDRSKCENCRQAKKKCIAIEHGCARCRDKEVDCPGRTKARAASKRPFLSPQGGDTRPLSSSFLGTQNEWENSSGLNYSDCLEPEAIPTDQSQSQKQITTPDSMSEQIAQAMEEIDGLEIGMEMMDWGSDDDGIDEGLQPKSPCHQSLPVHENGSMHEFLTNLVSDYSALVHQVAKTKDFQVAKTKDFQFLLWGGGIFYEYYELSFEDIQDKIQDIRDKVKDMRVKLMDLMALPEIQTPSSSAHLGLFYHHLASIERSPTLIESLSATEYLLQIYARGDGHLVCSSPTCKLPPFEASLAGLVDHISIHTGRPSEEIYRDFANLGGFIRRLLQQAAMNRKRWDSWTFKSSQIQLALNIQRLDQGTLCYEGIPETRQFQDFDKLMKAFRARYWSFLRSASISSPGLSAFAAALRTFHRTPQGLCRLGLRVFRLVLAGGAPTTTLGVFAFALLSGAMTDVMQNLWNKEILHQPQNIDYLVWREAIHDDDERVLFDHLMHDWFPQSHLLQDDTSPLPPSSHKTMRDYILNLIGSLKAKGSSNFSAFSSSEMAKSMYNTGVQTRQMDHGAFDSLWGIGSAAWQGGGLQVGPKPITVRESIIFVGAYLFMIYVTERGILVIYLGNKDRRCELLGFEATAGNILQVSERLKSEVIDPLLTAFSDAPEFSGLLEAAKVMIDYGQTWAVQHLHGALKLAVKDEFKDQTSQDEWLTVIALKCRSADGLIAPAWVL